MRIGCRALGGCVLALACATALADERPSAPPAAAVVQYDLKVDAPAEIERWVREFTLLGRWRSRDDYDPSQLPLFIRRAPGEIASILAAEGYFEPEISVEATASGAFVQVVPGRRATVAGVELLIRGPLENEAYTRQRERVLQSWQLLRDNPFQSRVWDRAKRELLEAAGEQGFLRARIVASQADVDIASATVSLRVELESGARMSFGPLQVVGLERYPIALLEGLRGYREGEPFRASELAEFQSRLNGSGYFTSVGVSPDLQALAADPALDRVPVRVQLTEAQAKRLTLGGGVDTDRGLNVQANWENRNVMQRGLRWNSGFELDQRRQLVFSTIDALPDASLWRWQLGVRAFHNDVLNDLVDAGSIFISRARSVGDTEASFSLQWQFERQSIVFAAGDELRQQSEAAVLGYAWTRRRLDSAIFPTSGYLLAGQISGASEAMGSSRSFARLYGSGLRIFSLPGNGALSGSRLVVRGESGLVFAGGRDGIPSQNLFRTGGTRSVRGYASQSLGQRVGQATLGARYLLVGSAEIQFPMTPQVDLAFFYDRGNAMDQRSDFSTVAGYGTGVRWRTPVGPLNADFAYGEAERSWRFHLSLGVVF